MRQELQLLTAEPLQDGTPSWRIVDPLRNRYFEIGWTEFQFLKHWSEGGDPEELLLVVSSSSSLRPSRDELDVLLAFLDRHELTTTSTTARRDALLRRCAARTPPIWKQVLHHYLFFRIPVLHPDAWLERNATRFYWVFGTRFLTITAIAGIVGIFLAMRQSTELYGAFAYFFNIEGLFFYGAAALFAKLLHELGHALGAKKNGLHVPTIGIALLVMMPVLYTDTSETWKLSDRRRRFGVAIAGIAAELTLAAWCTLAWAITPDSALRSAFFLLATTTWVWTLGINASPFMRFDGYFLLSDLVGLPNLHERSFMLARRLLRSFFFGYELVDPEPGLSPRTKQFMIIFALLVWAYRFVVFMGIAVLVYQFFFKPLGVFLMAVEIGWFVALPIWREMKSIGEERANWRLSSTPWVIAALALALLAWLQPIRHHINAPAILRAAQEATIFPPSAGRLTELRVRQGQRVQKNELLAVIESPELISRALRAEVRSTVYTEEVARATASRANLERRQVLEQQLNEALADYTGARSEIQALHILAPHEGIIRDVPSDLVLGRWLNTQHPLMRVVTPGNHLIEAYFTEAQLDELSVGQEIRFYSEDPALKPVDGQISRIDRSSSRIVPHPLLASVHGGEITAVKAEKDILVPHDAIYHVIITPTSGQPTSEMVMRGSVRINASWLAIIRSGLARVASVLVRESGF